LDSGAVPPTVSPQRERSAASAFKRPAWAETFSAAVDYAAPLTGSSNGPTRKRNETTHLMSIIYILTILNIQYPLTN